MNVHVHLFGPAADAAGADAVTVRLPEGAGCADLRRELTGQYPALEGLVQAGRFAINHEFASEDQPLTGSDEVALIALVSGG